MYNVFIITTALRVQNRMEYSWWFDITGLRYDILQYLYALLADKSLSTVRTPFCLGHIFVEFALHTEVYQKFVVNYYTPICNKNSGRICCYFYL